VAVVAVVEEAVLRGVVALAQMELQILAVAAVVRPCQIMPVAMVDLRQ
jgi:hypothetical protein